MSAIASWAAFVAGGALGVPAGAAAAVAWARVRPRSGGGRLAAAVAPIESTLGRVEDRLRQLELDRREDRGALSEQVRLLRESQEVLRSEAASLSRALRSPNQRGRWGELQLRRVVEMAGMVPHCDFVEQRTLAGGGDGDGGARPDLIVRLPGRKLVAVDAKVPLDAYLLAVDAADDDTRRRHLADHARLLRGHVGALASRSYWTRMAGSPEFVVAFLPGDALLASALEADPGLIDHAVANQVLLATPTTLIALLRSVSYGWRQEAVAENARAVCDLGRELHRRLSTFAEHLAGVGRGLDRAVDAYNRSVGSLETRVLVSARRLGEMGVADEDVDAPPALGAVARVPSVESPSGPERDGGDRIAG